MDKQKFITRLGQLIEIPSISGNVKENAKALDLVESWVDNDVTKRRIKNGKAEILLLGNGNLLKPDYGYLVHIDVVNAQDPQMFKICKENGKLIGRGVSDMKFSIPLGIELLNELIKSKNNINFTLAITTDEEVGGSEGGNYLANVMKFHPKIMVVPDGGGNFTFVNKSKGVAHIWVTSHGKPAHASVPWLGKNALEPIVILANQLIGKYRADSQKPNWNTTMNLGNIEGGKSTNQVCDRALMKIDFRFPESRSVQEILDEVTILGKKIDPSLEITLAASGDPTFTNIENPEIVRFLKITQEILNKKITVKGTEGASDARYWARHKIPTIMIKPNSGDNHGEIEWIDINSCLKFYEILRTYVLGR